MIDVIDYGGGNVGSVQRCLERLQAAYRMVSATQLPTGDNPLLLPGVGAFGATMTKLSNGGLAKRIRELVQAGTPYLGICVGLQVLFERSGETPDVEGLGLLPGSIVRFQGDSACKIPQIGWNWVESQQDGWPDGYVYFVNSFYPQPKNPEVSLYEADYHGAFTAAVRYQNITAFQFHPEKSGPFGETLLRRWLNDVQ